MPAKLVPAAFFGDPRGVLPPFLGVPGGSLDPDLVVLGEVGTEDPLVSGPAGREGAFGSFSGDRCISISRSGVGVFLGVGGGW